MQAIYWLIIFVVLLVIEFATMGLTTIWFAIGALGAIAVALIGGDLIIQLLVFFVLSVVILVSMRPFATRYINKGRVKTNAESLIGMTGKVTEKIDNIAGKGTVVINGQEWTARTDNDIITIDEGALVEIKEISGVKLSVNLKKYEAEE